MKKLLLLLVATLFLPALAAAQPRTVTIKHTGIAAATINTSLDRRTQMYTYTIKVDGIAADYTETTTPAAMSPTTQEVRSATLNEPVPAGSRLTVEVEISPTYTSFYKLIDLTANGEDILQTKSYTVGDDDVEIDINVNMPAKLQVTIPDGVEYTLTHASGETVDVSNVKVGQRITLTITGLPEGKAVDKVTTDGTVMGHAKQEEVAVRENCYEFSVRYSTTLLDVTLKTKPCAINYSVPGGGGTLTAAVEEGDAVASGQTVDYNTSVVLTAAPAEGYELDDLTVDGHSVKAEMKGDSYTFTATDNHTIVATFILIDGIETAAGETLRLVCTAGQLRIEGMPAGAQAAVYSLTGALVKVSAESTVDLSAQPAGCYLVKVSGDGISKTMKFIKK